MFPRWWKRRRRRRRLFYSLVNAAIQIASQEEEEEEERKEILFLRPHLGAETGRGMEVTEAVTAPPKNAAAASFATYRFGRSSFLSLYFSLRSPRFFGGKRGERRSLSLSG